MSTSPCRESAKIFEARQWHRVDLAQPDRAAARSLPAT
jgi:hypothetical protein